MAEAERGVPLRESDLSVDKVLCPGRPYPSPSCVAGDTPLAGSLEICLEAQTLMDFMGAAHLCPFPFSHHVIKPKDISWWYFSSKNENQAGVIPTENKKHTNVKHSSDGQGTRTGFLPVNANKLMLLCALYNHTYCNEEAAVNLWKLPVAPLAKCSERRNRYILKNVLLMKRGNIFV